MSEPIYRDLRSARGSYRYRSQYFTSIGRLNASQFTAEYKELDPPVGLYKNARVCCAGVTYKQ
jgi:hypothetical protein